MGIQDHGIMGDVLENMGHGWKCSQTTKSISNGEAKWIAKNKKLIF
jgi:hypothetical protein